VEQRPGDAGIPSLHQILCAGSGSERQADDIWLLQRRDGYGTDQAMRRQTDLQKSWSRQYIRITFQFQCPSLELRSTPRPTITRRSSRCNCSASTARIGSGKAIPLAVTISGCFFNRCVAGLDRDKSSAPPFQHRRAGMDQILLQPFRAASNQAPRGDVGSHTRLNQRSRLWTGQAVVCPGTGAKTNELTPKLSISRRGWPGSLPLHELSSLLDPVATASGTPWL
jgi:hypothetical protein